MEYKYKHKIKYIDFNNITLLSWHIRDTSIEHISRLSKIVTPSNLYKIIFPYEFIILSTCNRVEIYIYSYKSQKLSEDIKTFINNELGNDKCILGSLDLLEGKRAYRHLLEVTAGLKSLALGEYQIQGQVKNAYINAMRDRYISSYLISIFESALKTGKRIRTETEIGHNNISLSSLAIDMMFQLNKPKKENPILIVGTGKMSKLAAEYFFKLGHKSIIFFSNNPDKRKDFAKKYSSVVLSLKELELYMKKYKFIFSAISSSGPNISSSSLEGRLGLLSIIDLSVPSYFRKSATTNSNSIIIDMDTIKQLESSYFRMLKPTLKKCEYILNEEINGFVLDHRHRYELSRAQISS